MRGMSTVEIKTRLKGRKKKQLRDEQEKILLEQEKLRRALAECETIVRKLQAKLIKELSKDEGERRQHVIYLIQNNYVPDYKDRIERIERQYRANAEILKIYSEILKNRGDTGSARLRAAASCISGAAGIALGAVGMAKAYEADAECKLTNKGVLAFITKLPIFRNIGGEIK